MIMGVRGPKKHQKKLPEMEFSQMQTTRGPIYIYIYIYIFIYIIFHCEFYNDFYFSMLEKIIYITPYSENLLEQIKSITLICKEKNRYPKVKVHTIFKTKLLPYCLEKFMTEICS